MQACGVEIVNRLIIRRVFSALGKLIACVKPRYLTIACEDLGARLGGTGKVILDSRADGAGKCLHANSLASQ